MAPVVAAAVVPASSTPELLTGGSVAAVNDVTREAHIQGQLAVLGRERNQLACVVLLFFSNAGRDEADNGKEHNNKKGRNTESLHDRD